MATYRVGQETHPTVLPQQPALEFESADNPRIRDETGLEDRTAVSGAVHVREEIPGASPGTGDVTPSPQVGEKPRERHSSPPYVFVLDKHHRPLQPCTAARARKLPTKGRAVVHRHTPFVIRIKDRTIEQSVDGVALGIDPGSKHTGVAVFTAVSGQRRGRYGVQLDHRGAIIREKLQQRSAYRRGRRTRNLRYRAPRFLNRTKPKGWLAPSLRHRVETTMSWTRRLARWAPVHAVHMERVAFDTHALSAGRPLEGIEYQHGTLHGTEVREYLLAKFGRACTYCGTTGVPLNIDHIHPRSRGGSDRVSNLTFACIGCNQAKGNRPVEDFAPRLAADIPRRAAGCSGRGTHTRTRTDKHGFPRLRMSRIKQFFDYQTGDLVRAVVPTGKKTGTYTGRVAVRATGNFNITTAHATVQGIWHKHLRLLQRADGYTYTTQSEDVISDGA